MSKKDYAQKAARIVQSALEEELEQHFPYQRVLERLRRNVTPDYPGHDKASRAEFELRMFEELLEEERTRL